MQDVHLQLMNWVPKNPYTKDNPFLSPCVWLIFLGPEKKASVGAKWIPKNS